MYTDPACCRNVIRLLQIRWRRVVLDEAHNIKDRRCNTAQAAFALTARHRWCLSGTPLQNRVNELYSLVRFLRVHPYSHYFADKTGCVSLDFPFKNDLRKCALRARELCVCLSSSRCCTC